MTTNVAREGEIVTVQRILAHAEPFAGFRHCKQLVAFRLTLGGHTELHFGCTPNLL